MEWVYNVALKVAFQSDSPASDCRKLGPDWTHCKLYEAASKEHRALLECEDKPRREFIPSLQEVLDFLDKHSIPM